MGAGLQDYRGCPYCSVFVLPAETDLEEIKFTENAYIYGWLGGKILKIFKRPFLGNP